MKDVPRKVKKYRIYFWGIGTACGVILTSLYALLAILGLTYMNVWIALSSWFSVFLLDLIFSYFLWKYRDLLSQSVQLFFLLFNAVTLWYLSFATSYNFLIVAHLTDLQLAVVVFAYLWEVPIVGGLLFSYTACLWFKPFGDYFAGRLTLKDPEGFYKKLLRYPVSIGGWVFVCSLIAYVLGSFQQRYIAQFPILEAIKNITIGIAVATFFAIALYLLLDLFLDKIRKKVQEEYPLLNTPKRKLVSKVAGTSIFVAIGTVILVTLFTFRFFQAVIRENIALKMSELQAQSSLRLRDAKNSLDEQSALNFFRYGDKGEVFSLTPDTLMKFSNIAPETKEYILSHPQGIVDDSHNTLKLVSFFRIPNGHIILSLVNLTEFYTPFIWPLGFFVLGIISIFLVTIIVSAYISIIITESVRTLSNSIHRLSKEPRSSPEKIYTSDEIQELSQAFSTYVGEVQKMESIKNEFILASQHNLRTPLTIAKGYLEEALSQTKTGNPESLAVYLTKTTETLDTMTDLVNGLIDVTELEVGKEGFSKKENL